MADTLAERGRTADSQAWFAATHWSVVLAAGADEGRRRAVALEILCRTYWEPLYAYLRRLGYPVHDAEDLTQGFLAHLLNGRPFEGLSPDKGKFRSFLLAALKNFIANERERANAAKRGGGQVILPLDQQIAEVHLAQEGGTPGTAECSFDRRWAMTVLKRAHAQLEREWAASGKAGHFARLSPFLAREGKGSEYAGLAGPLGLTAGAVGVAVHRMRQRYRACIRAEIAQTVTTPGEVEEEMRYLLELLISEARAPQGG